MKRIIILLLGAICLIRCGQDEFWSYQYNGVFLCSKDVGFYPVEADFFPSENGCDLLVITQKDEDGKITATSGFIVKYKKGDLELIDGANGSPVFGIKLENGRLADIAPTILSVMGLEQPAEMTGRSLIEK